MNYMRQAMVRGMAREIRSTFMEAMRDVMGDAVPLDGARRPSEQWLQGTREKIRIRVADAARAEAWPHGEAAAMLEMLFETATVDICSARFTLYGEEVR
jgi:hypothetical protein